MVKQIALCIAVFLTFSLSAYCIGTIPANDPNIQYTGRIVFDDPLAPEFGWPGCYLIANFEGTSINVKLHDYGDNYFYVIIDDGVPSLINLTPGAATYTAATGLTDSVHKIQLFKRTETQEGKAAFTGFELDDGKSLVAPPERPQRRIEFFGDSITAGHSVAIPYPGSDTNDAWGKDNYYAHGAVTARNLNAEYHCIARSGIPLVRAYGSEIDMPNNYYYRHDPFDGGSHWDFDQWTPHIIVINLGQNDKWYGVTQAEAEEAYVDFGLTLRGHYPDAEIIYALGNMDCTAPGSNWPTYVENAVNELKTTYGDTKVYSLMFPYGDGSHPDASQQAVMATQLTDFIQTNIPGFGDGDLNGDRVINLADFGKFGLHWLDSDCDLCYGADLSGDSTVDVNDLKIMANNWTTDFTLKGHWKFDESHPSSTAADSSYYGRDGTVNGGAVFQPLEGNNGALLFDGFDDYIEMDTTSYKGIPGTSSRTVSAWLSTTDTGTIVSWGDSAIAGGWWFFWVESGGRLRLQSQGGQIIGVTDLRDDSWHHVAAVLRDDGSADNSEVELYVDGIEEEYYSNISSERINTVLNENVTIGATIASDVLSFYFTGMLDDVRIYNRAMSSNEVADIVGHSGILAHWELDDDPCGLTAVDSSGYNHDGMLINMDPNNWIAGKVGSGALDFNGIDEYVEMIGYKGTIGNRSRTVAVWINTNAIAGTIAAWGENIVNGGRWSFIITDSGLLKVVVRGGYIIGSTDVRGGWHHVAAVLEDNGNPDVSQVKLYVDGELESVSDVLNYAIDTTYGYDVTIGGSQYGGNLSNLFEGQMDDVRIYGIALTEAEIQALAGMGG